MPCSCPVLPCPAWSKLLAGLSVLLPFLLLDLLPPFLLFRPVFRSPRLPVSTFPCRSNQIPLLVSASPCLSFSSSLPSNLPLSSPVPFLSISFADGTQSELSKTGLDEKTPPVDRLLSLFQLRRRPQHLSVFLSFASHLSRGDTSQRPSTPTSLLPPSVVGLSDRVCFAWLSWHSRPFSLRPLTRLASGTFTVLLVLHPRLHLFFSCFFASFSSLASFLGGGGSSPLF